ncbi:conserved hypothetical protein [Vibrio nigripulchritudo MADA3029]|uniref:Uncharacterized protein n=2 Tax=Vibrio nigripulchritudo TaxID=28173 RepID=A0AAV2VSY1_9VIBR|nr:MULTISPECIES: hypothetical protein [Vibrio]EGU54780.1 hypothetical protein VINI7043_03773 [Vibrio nigripulchritudo ATCC 27043]KJY73683.1 hypothetical protein TW74_20335 [Vibrio nigripulchritudo]UAB73581.1 hypothetical protein INR79_20695 [Vibrio sp. SCSIO 43132]CCN36292.1 conserved hypothetical protein [Vibrio nigripulchritudo AM115]CCN44392.1 conserved hypothetical protein [Vibrio nigripulchritudo FTn2]
MRKALFGAILAASVISAPALATPKEGKECVNGYINNISTGGYYGRDYDSMVVVNINGQDYILDIYRNLNDSMGPSILDNLLAAAQNGRRVALIDHAHSHKICDYFDEVRVYFN